MEGPKKCYGVDSNDGIIYHRIDIFLKSFLKKFIYTRGAYVMAMRSVVERGEPITLKGILDRKRETRSSEKSECKQLLEDLPQGEKQKLRSKSLIESIERTRNKGNFPVIAEIKKGSPLRDYPTYYADDDVTHIARQMQKGGACGISVLTESSVFKGNQESLLRVKLNTDLPVMRKDFILPEFGEEQIKETSELGADVVLLISSVLGDKTKELVDYAHECKIEPLVEVRTEEDLDIALESRTELLGFNNRELHTRRKDFDLGEAKTTIKNTSKLARLLQDKLKERNEEDRKLIVVSESGIGGPKDITEVSSYGAHAALIGSAIMLSPDISGKVRTLTRISKPSKRGTGGSVRVRNTRLGKEVQVLNL